MKQIKTAKVVKLAGSIPDLARLLGISRQAVSKWGLTVPELQCYRLQDLKPEWFDAKAAGRRK